MLRFMFHKLIHKKWMIVSLLIGNILLIAIAASHPMYKNASLQRMLTDEFENVIEEKNTYPALITLQATADKEDKYVFNQLNELSRTICDKLGIRLYQKMDYYSVTSTKVQSLYKRADNFGDIRALVGTITNLKDNISIISGTTYSSTIGEDGFIDAVISQSALVSLNLLIGEELVFTNLLDKEGNPIKLRIVGVYENNGVNDDYWVKSPNSYSGTCMIDEDIFMELFLNENDERFNVRGMWYIQPDYRSITPEHSETILKLTKAYSTEYLSPNGNFQASGYKDILENFGQNEKKINLTLVILQVPIIVLLCAFLYMISGQMLRLEQNEISQLKSRGASQNQILFIYFFQSTFLGLISMGIGIPLGSYLCRVLGSSNAFLEFVQRRPLTVNVTLDVFVYALMALFISILMTVLPVIKYSRISIVHLKQGSGKVVKNLWKKYYFDIIFLFISLYGLYIFNSQKMELANKVLTGASLDPLLFLSSSLFILGAGLLALRIQPYIIRVLFVIGKKVWNPANYVSFLQILRTGSKQYFIMIFLILTVALGMFNATIARTILSNAEESVRYNTGADIVLKEVWDSNEALVQMEPDTELVYIEPDFNRFSQIEGVKGSARVYTNDNVNFKLGKNTIKTNLLAINTKEFGETTHIKEGILPFPYREYLNILANDGYGILVSMNYKTKLGYKVGDTINYSNYAKVNVPGVIYGFIDYWPSYIPTTTTILPDGSTNVEDNYLIIAHFATVTGRWGLTPYEVWLRLDNNVEPFYHYVTENPMRFLKFMDIQEELKDIRNETLFQGTNGILTLSFIVILLLCSVGFLIYWILSIRSRELLFGVFRAMGMTRREIIHLLMNEQIFSSLYSIIAGICIGHYASKWYVPLIQIAYSATDQVLPLELITKENDMIRLFSVIGIVVVICIAILVRIIFKMKITQALKLGED